MLKQIVTNKDRGTWEISKYMGMIENQILSYVQSTDIGILEGIGTISLALSLSIFQFGCNWLLSRFSSES